MRVASEHVYHQKMETTGAVLVANGALEWTEELTRIAAFGRPLLAADGGGDHLARIGLRPDAVIGDLDSISGSARRWVGEERLVVRPDQDRTDLEKALAYAFDELEVEQLTVLAALGGRSDHESGNLGLLAREALGTSLVYRQADSLVLAASGNLELPAVPGETWSFWTYDPAVRVTIEGVHWPMERARLDVAGRPSVSNLATAKRVRLEAEGGAVVVMRWLADHSG